MTEQFADVIRESPRASKVLVALFSCLIAFVVLALGWQQWVYSQQRQDVREIALRQEGLIKALADRQDTLRAALYDLRDVNSRQDIDIAKQTERTERYSCDVKELKEAMKAGFDKLATKIEMMESKRLYR